MTDITDRHTLRRMSWSELFTAAQEAEFQRDYERARIVWSFALHVATTTINKNLAIAHIRRCDTLLHKSKNSTRKQHGGPVSVPETPTSPEMTDIPD
ncbi:Neurotensin receptor R8 [Escherichia coli]|nr:Neurotensin receptor R8 [Escherichia coli]